VDIDLALVPDHFGGLDSVLAERLGFVLQSIPDLVKTVNYCLGIDHDSWNMGRGKAKFVGDCRGIASQLDSASYNLTNCGGEAQYFSHVGLLLPFSTCDAVGSAFSDFGRLTTMIRETD